jgi:AraC-like DNA-binding protein
MAQSHQHQEVELNYLESGSMTYLMNGRRVSLPSGHLAFFWASVPHQVVRSEQAKGFYWLTVPLAWVMRWSLPAGLLEVLLSGRYCCEQQAHPLDGPSMRSWHEALQRRDAAWQRPVILELEARFLRFALDHRRDYPARRLPAKVHAAAEQGGKVERLARYIAEHYTEEISIPEIAAQTGLHPNYAMNLFRQSCGQTLLDCLVQHRIAHAQRLLLTTDRKVIDIALESGFGSLSQFYEAFGRRCGQTPLAYRRRLQVSVGAAENRKKKANRAQR